MAAPADGGCNAAALPSDGGFQPEPGRFTSRLAGGMPSRTPPVPVSSSGDRHRCSPAAERSPMLTGGVFRLVSRVFNRPPRVFPGFQATKSLRQQQFLFLLGKTASPLDQVGPAGSIGRCRRQPVPEALAWLSSSRGSDATAAQLAALTGWGPPWGDGSDFATDAA